MSGTLALIGGGEWREGCTFDRTLLETSGGRDVLLLPTGAAYEQPERLTEQATRWFEDLGATVRTEAVLTRPDALDEAHAEAVRGSAFTYLAGGSPMHLRSVLKDSPVWEALLDAWRGGAVVAASSAGAMVLCDPMVDPRGGALTIGLGLVEQVAAIPHFDQWSDDKAKRTLRIAPSGLRVVGIDERTAAVRGPDGTWTAQGAGRVQVFMGAEPADLDVLP